jgi:CDP-diacylglycerol--glycerol-3-phosphate 3-phosphatidyltransferase
LIGGIVKGYLERTVGPFYRFLANCGISPNLLTFTGLGISLVASGLLWAGKFRVAGLVMLVGGVFDMMDGGVARARGGGNSFGAFLDSLVDRYSDLFLLTGLILFFAGQGKLGFVALGCLAMVGTALVPYARARAECFIPSCTVGWMERPERILLMAAGALLEMVELALAILAILAHFTVLQRIHFCWQRLPGGKSPGEREEGQDGKKPKEEEIGAEGERSN